MIPSIENRVHFPFFPHLRRVLTDDHINFNSSNSSSLMNELLQCSYQVLDVIYGFSGHFRKGQNLQSDVVFDAITTGDND